jgi:hypothetical protein
MRNIKSGRKKAGNGPTAFAVGKVFLPPEVARDDPIRNLCKLADPTLPTMTNEQTDEFL